MLLHNLFSHVPMFLDEKHHLYDLILSSRPILSVHPHASLSLKTTKHFRAAVALCNIKYLSICNIYVISSYSYLLSVVLKLKLLPLLLSRGLAPRLGSLLFRPKPASINKLQKLQRFFIDYLDSLLFPFFYLTFF